jgi:hypothetical protein
MVNAPISEINWVKEETSTKA